MAFWRKDNKKNSIVVIALRKNSIYALRGFRSAENPPLKIQAEAVFSMDNKERLPSLLQQKLNWQPEEQIFITKPSPLLAGTSISLVLPRHDEEHPVIRDAREILHRAQWRASDSAREEAANFFGCSLEEVEPYGSAIERWKETSEEVEATIFQACVPRWNVNEEYLSLPGANQFLMPMVLGQEVGNTPVPEAILHTEDNLSVLVVRQNNILKKVRTVNCGIDTIRGQLQKSLDCSPHEADVLMQHCLEGKLSEGGQKTILRVMRQLLPLWAGMFAVGMDNIPENERPRKLLVTGLYPKLIAKLYCRPQILMRWSHENVKVSILAQQNDLLGYPSALRTSFKYITRQTAGVKVPATVNFGLRAV